MEESEIDLRAIFGLLRRQIRLIVLTLIAVVSIATVWVLAQTPVYTASSLLMFDPSSKNLLEGETVATSSAADNARIDSEVELMRSDSILLDVIRTNNLVSDEEFGVSLSLRQRVMSMLRLGTAELPTGEQALNQTLSKLRSAVSVQRRGTTYLLSIQVSSRSPAKAAELANAIARSYINEQLTAKIDNTLSARDILQASIAEARNAIVVSENSFDEFIASNIDEIVSESGNSNIASLQAQIAELERLREERVSTADAVAEQLDNGDFASVVASLQDDALNELERQRNELGQQIAQVGDQTPAAVDLRTRLAEIEDQLREGAQTQVEQLRTAVSSTQTEEETLREQVRSAVVNSDLSADALTQIFELQQSAALARGQYETLLARVQTLETEASLQVSDARLVSPALPPSRASFPNVNTTLVIATLLALGLGVALAFLYENYLGGFTSAEQLQSVLKVTGAIGAPRERIPDGGQSVADLIVNSPLSVFAESTRRLRAYIDQAMRKKAATTPAEAAANADAATMGSVIMVTSAVPNEGKTTTALALARSYALSGRSTLLIDCDMRRPSLHRHLNVEPDHGLVDFLEAQPGKPTSIDEVVTRDPLSSAIVILGTRRSALPTDQLVGSEAFTRLLVAARRAFSIVILDTPPVGAVVDGLYIAPHVDLVTFVSRWSSTPQTEARSSVESLRAATMGETEILGVLSQQELSRRAYSSKYGNYYSEPTS